MTSKSKVTEDTSTAPTLPPEDGAMLEAPAPLYETRMWKGVLPTFRCAECGHCDQDQEEMILHVVTHLPEQDRDSAFDQLMKEIRP